MVVRILGGVRSWQHGFDALAATGVPTVVLGGEQAPDAELMGRSTVPLGTAAQAQGLRRLIRRLPLINDSDIIDQGQESIRRGCAASPRDRRRAQSAP